MTKTEHIAWCRKRAIGHLPSNPSEAVWGMMCDLRKHKSTESYTHDPTVLRIAANSTADPTSARNFINGIGGAHAFGRPWDQ